MATPYDDRKQRRIVAEIAKYNGIDPARFRVAQQNFLDGSYTFAFNAYAVPPELKDAARTVRAMLADEFRGEIIKAAVPEFAKQVAALMDKIDNAKDTTIRLSEHDYNELARRIDVGML